jgi:hypothetical protein
MTVTIEGLLEDGCLKMNDLRRYMLVQIRLSEKAFTIDLSSHLPLAGLDSLDQVSEVETSVYFPPATYSNTGRTAEMPDTYQCVGSGSCVMRLDDGQSRALSVALFHDTTMHDGTEHVNAYIYAWPVKISDPDWTNKLGECHKLPVGEDITLIVAPNTDREQAATVRAEHIDGKK